MTVHEMHIELEQALQQVGAARTRKYREDEFDWVLNQMVNRFVMDCIDPKKNGSFTVNQSKEDRIRTLLKYRTLEASRLDSITYQAPLPGDYFCLISDSCNAVDLCGTAEETVSQNNTLYFIPVPLTTKTEAPYYTAISYEEGNNDVALPGQLPLSTAYLGYNSKASWFHPIKWLYQELLERGVDIYWERYGNVYKPRHFILRSASAALTPSLTIDGFAAAGSLTTITDTLSVNTSDTFIANRLTSSETIPTYLSTSFYKPTAMSPVSELIDNTIRVYTDKSYTVNRIRIGYLKKPRSISLALGTDCDIAPDYHWMICNLAVEYIKGRLQNKEGKDLATQDLLRVNL